MTTTTAPSTAVIQRARISDISRTRRISTGVIEILVAVFISFVFGKTLQPDMLTKFVMTPGGITVGSMGDWVIRSQFTLYLLAAICVVI